jgi:uncharacterized membrane protein
MKSAKHHGMSLLYHSKAMDLSSLSVNMDEDIVPVAEPLRNDLITAENKVFADFDETLKRFGYMSFNRAILNVFGKDDLLQSSVSTPVGSIYLYPLKIHGDTFVFSLYVPDLPDLDHRKMIPTFEAMHGMLDELRKITLVRGINFEQQEQILQQHANRFIQHAEIEFLQGSWNAGKAPSAKTTIDEIIALHSAPEFMRIAMVTMPWHVNYLTNRLELSEIEATQELDTLEEVDETRIIDLTKLAPPVPLVPSLVTSSITALNDAWKVIESSFVPAWKRKLVEAFVRRYMTEIQASTFTIDTPLPGIETAIDDAVGDNLEKLIGFLAGVDKKLDDGEEQTFDLASFTSVYDGFKEIYITVDGQGDIFDSIAAAYDAWEKTGHYLGSPTATFDFKQFVQDIKKTLQRLQTAFKPVVLKNIRVELARQVTSTLESRLATELLETERGAVKQAGTKMLAKAIADLLKREVEKIAAGAETNGESLLDMVGFSVEFTNILHESTTVFKIDVDDLVQFANDLLDDDAQRAAVYVHVQKFATLKSDIYFLRDFLLKPETFNQFLEKHAAHFYDPLSFSKQFSDFISEDLEQLPLDWASLASNWLVAFSNLYQVQYAQKAFDRAELLRRFFDFISIVVEGQVSFEQIFAIITSYSSTVTDPKEKKGLIEYMKRFEQSQGAQEQLPAYLENKIDSFLNEQGLGSLVAASLEQEGSIESVIARSVEDLASISTDIILVPAETVFQAEKDTRIEFKISIDMVLDRLSVHLSTNAFKLVDFQPTTGIEIADQIRGGEP